MPPLNVSLLRSSFALVIDRQPELTTRFYELLFDRYPSVLPLFSGVRMQDQQRMLGEALVALLEHIENADWLADHLTALGAKHVQYGVTDDMYPWVGECLLAAIEEAAGSAWSAELGTAWSDAYAAIAGLMLTGARLRRAVAESRVGTP